MPELRTMLTLLGAFFIGGGLLVYLIFQARFLLIGPVVEFSTELEPVSNERAIEVVGTAQNVSHLTLNGHPIFTNEQGVFSESLVLENGYTIMTVRARDRYGRERVLTRSFVYRPASGINL